MVRLGERPGQRLRPHSYTYTCVLFSHRDGTHNLSIFIGDGQSNPFSSAFLFSLLDIPLKSHEYWIIMYCVTMGRKATFCVFFPCEVVLSVWMDLENPNTWPEKSMRSCEEPKLRTSQGISSELWFFSNIWDLWVESREPCSQPHEALDSGDHWPPFFITVDDLLLFKMSNKRHLFVTSGAHLSSDLFVESLSLWNLCNKESCHIVRLNLAVLLSYQFQLYIQYVVTLDSKEFSPSSSLFFVLVSITLSSQLTYDRLAWVFPRPLN